MTTHYKVTELFCIIDEFCKHFDAENAGNLRAKQFLSAFCYYPLLMVWGGGVFTLHLYCIRHSAIPNWGHICDVKYDFGAK